MPVLFRIKDLLTDRTLIESKRGLDIVAYHYFHFQEGKSKWRWQYTGPYGWTEIPLRIRRTWRARSGR